MKNVRHIQVVPESKMAPKLKPFEMEHTADEHQSVYPSLRPVLTMTMFLGMTPITNVWAANNGKGLQFRWLRPQAIYSIATVLVLLFGTCISVSSNFFIFSTALDISFVAISLTNPVFCISTTLSSIQCIYVSRKLPALMQHWDHVTSTLTKYTPGKRDLSHPKIPITAGLLAASAIIHIVINDLTMPFDLCHNYTENYFQCYLTWGDSNSNTAFRTDLPVAILYWIGLKYAHIAWNVHDILIIVLALALREDFKVLANYIQSHYEDITISEEWRIVREDHLAVIDVSERMDTILSVMILQSYAHNLFTICTGVLVAIRPRDVETPMQVAHFHFSLFHTILRTCIVSISASEIHEQATAPLEQLFQCPVLSYCTEVHRFVHHIMNTKIGLTGCKFFVVTKSVFLAMLSLIITYELILLNLT